MDDSIDSIHRYTFGYDRRFAESWERIFGSDDDPEDEENKNGREIREGTDERAGSGVIHTDG